MLDLLLQLTPKTFDSEAVMEGHDSIYTGLVCCHNVYEVFACPVYRWVRRPPVSLYSRVWRYVSKDETLKMRCCFSPIDQVQNEILRVLVDDPYNPDLPFSPSAIALFVRKQ